MWFNQLDKHDYKILENYWFNYRQLAREESENQERARNIGDILKAIETLYNGSNGLMRDFIELTYFDSSMKVPFTKHIAEQLNVTVNKVNRLREALMKDTAELIGWV